MLQQWQQQQQLPTEKTTQLETLQQQLHQKQKQQQQLTNQLANYPTQDFYSRFYTDYHSLQIRLFELARQFQLQEALRRQSELLTAINTYIGVLSREGDAGERNFGWLSKNISFEVISNK